MKPASFEYFSPTTISEALDLLSQFGTTARALAGGQSLVPMMNFRLARPSHLIDLNRIPELSYVTVENGELRIGAMTRQREIERSAAVLEGWPLLKEATGYIGHVQIRNRGTVGGSLAHAYPASELPVAMCALDAVFVLRSQRGERLLKARELFVGPMTTVLEPEELLIEIRVPPLPARTGWAFQEISRRFGDFALMAVACLLTLDGAGAIQKASLAFTDSTPVRPESAEQRLVGKRPDRDLFSEVGRLAAAALNPDTDVHASAEYRREIAGVLARRALQQAAERAASFT
ncbi:MAG: xanthine dehydrogenase family protein subunit M [Deltaproteobacteria bacterium]|nr:xanthine dehydrogenase family protein subunit M [Deltaproteobacteria bacterium]